jgi:predicted secreted protein
MFIVAAPRSCAVLILACLLTAAAQAQPCGGSSMRAATELAAPVVNLSAQASAEVLADTLAVTLRVLRQGSDAAKLQAQLKQVIDAALADARRSAAAPGLEVRTGVFNISPRYGNNAAIVGWQGQAELILSGIDTALVAAQAGRLTGLQVVASSFSVSPALREKLEADLVAQAIERFRRRAALVAQGLGYADVVVRELAVSGADGEPPPRVMAMMARSADMASAESAPLPVEPGLVRLSASVQGSVHLLNKR